MKKFFKNYLLFFVIFILILGGLAMINSPFKKPQRVSLDQVVAKINQNEVQKIVVSQNKLQITLSDKTEWEALKDSNESFTAALADYGVAKEKIQNLPLEIKEEGGFSYWLTTLLPFILPFLLIAVFIWLMMRQVQGANNRALGFGQSRAREQSKNIKVKTTFKDVAGVMEAKQELWEVVEFLKNPKKFTSLGAKVPKGVLLLGAPGCGKTLLAKAVAGEANAPFFNISGSEFVEMFVGVGASRVRDLFDRAKKASPAIVFIDEIDAVGRQRGAGLGGSHDEREQTLNQILVEMDGFETDTSVIVVAATNRPDVLDPALLRPGRFDRQVIIDLPDIKDREAILAIHARNKPLASGVNLRPVAERTPGFSGADLSNILNEAAILAARRNKKQIGMTECLESIEKVMLGPERKSHLLNKQEKKITAYHEAGHALVAHQLPHVDPIQKVSIISRGQAAGYTIKLPVEDKHLHVKSEFTEDLAVMLAGHAVEKEIFKEVTTGASNDLRQATQLARKLVTEFGMSDKMGPRTFGQREEMIFLGREIHERRDYSEKIAELIDAEVDRFIKEAYHTAQRIIKTQKTRLETLVKVLLQKETLERKEFEALMA